MRVMSMLAVVVALVVGALSCSPCPPEPERPPIESYELICAVDADCALVSRPSCGGCGCAETPLRTVDTGRFVEDQTICCEGGGAAVPCEACIEGFAACVDGGCVFASCADEVFAGDSRCPQ